MNHARALVHIYQDGSIGISTGAVEMGQSVNTKMMQVAATVLSVKIDKIKILIIILFIGLIGRSVFSLIQQYRSKATGSRLTFKLVIMFIILSDSMFNLPGKKQG